MTRAGLNQKKFQKKFGERLRAMRVKRGWSLEDIEDHGYPSWQHFQKFETGLKDIRLSSILKICQVFDVTLSELFKDL